MTGKLVIVPTPIGNLGDMTARAFDALQTADAVCAEDTRVTGKLLAALGVEGKRVERLDENMMSTRVGQVIARVQAGDVIAYCSDAGMPGVSDPGLRLVAAARKADVPVEVLPGPTAAATAYVASGTTCPNFYFGAFLPRKEKACADLLEGLRALDAALVFYESPRRLVDSLGIVARVFPARTVTVCRELTKLHEEVVRGPALQVAEDFAARDSVKGEIVVVIDAATSEEVEATVEEQGARAEARAVELLSQGESAKSVAKQLMAEFGIARNVAYDIAYTKRS